MVLLYLNVCQIMEGFSMLKSGFVLIRYTVGKENIYRKIPKMIYIKLRINIKHSRIVVSFGKHTTSHFYLETDKKLKCV